MNTSFFFFSRLSTTGPQRRLITWNVINLLCSSLRVDSKNWGERISLCFPWESICSHSQGDSILCSLEHVMKNLDPLLIRYSLLVPESSLRSLLCNSNFHVRLITSAVSYSGRAQDETSVITISWKPKRTKLNWSSSHSSNLRTLTFLAW